MKKVDRTRKLVTENRLNTIQRVVKNRQLDLTVILENIHDPHNVAAIFRTADAVGIDEVNLLYNRERFPKLHPKVTASGAKWVKAHPFSDPTALSDSLRQRGFNLYSTHLSQDAIPIHEVDWTQPSAIILGNENRGVSDDLVNLADHNIIVPMFGMVRSLNVSVAAAVILFEVCRQRIASGHYPNQGLHRDWVEGKTESWINMNQKRSRTSMERPDPK